MGMSRVDETFEVYMQMRIAGKQAKAALEALRTRIETMPAADQAELVRRVKAWEGKHLGTVTAPPNRPPPTPRERDTFLPPDDRPRHANAASKAPSFDKPPSSDEAEESALPAAPATSAASKEPVKAANTNTVVCPRCGKPNNPNDIFCAYCGNFMRTEAGNFETTRLDDPDMISHGPDFFGPDSTLVLVIDSTSYSYKVQPQRYKHETVIGRSEGSTMKPDIDLTQHNAGEMGVSRLHVALQYNAKNNLLSVSDMKSANGTFINGQKLYPQEVRVLRDGDELRLGRLLLHIYFQHGERKG